MGGEPDTDGVEDPGPDEEDLARPRRPCGSKVAAEDLPRKRGAPITGGDDRLNAVVAKIGRHRVDQVDVLDGRDEADPAGAEEREGCLKHPDVEVEPDRLVNDVRPFLDRRVAKVDQNVGKPERVEREVAAPVARVAADDHLEPLAAEGSGRPRRLPCEPGGELEGDRPRSPSAELLDDVSNRYQ